MLRVDINEYGQVVPGQWVSFYVQDCGGTGQGQWPPEGQWPPGGQWPGQYAQIWAQVSPYAIEQGKKGTITLQASVGSYQAAMYSFEILNSWGQLWKRIAISKAPYERYQISLPVGANTKPGVLTYTVNLWLESGRGGERRKVASTRFSFRVITAGSAQSQYAPGYPGYPGYQMYPGYPEYSDYSGYPTYPGYPGGTLSGGEFSGAMPPYYGTSPYYEGAYPNAPYFYGSSYPQSSGNERQIQ